jgi:hypothetical protein
MIMDWRRFAYVYMYTRAHTIDIVLYGAAVAADASSRSRVFPVCNSDSSEAFRASSAADKRSLKTKSRGLLRGDGGMERFAGVNMSRGLPFTGVPALDRLPVETASPDDDDAAAAAAVAAAIGKLPVLCDARFKRSKRSTPSNARETRSAAIAFWLGDDVSDCVLLRVALTALDDASDVSSSHGPPFKTGVSDVAEGRSGERTGDAAAETGAEAETLEPLGTGERKRTGLVSR